MALRKSLSQRLLSCRRTPPLLPASKLSSYLEPLPDPDHPLRREHYISPEYSGGLLRRLFQRRWLNHAAGRGLMDRFSLPVGAELREQLMSLTSSKSHLRLDGVSSTAPEGLHSFIETSVSLFDVKKLLRLARLERLKSEIRAISENAIPYGDYLDICSRVCEDEGRGEEFAKTLDESGDVIIFGNVVFLRPEQVAKSMEAILYQTTAMPNDPRRRELEKLEEQKLEIDRMARAQVMAELYCGLGFLMVQTLGFMRLTFWELSWDVMEPICFFTASLHFAIAYGFFLRTSTEPSFEGYFNQRFMSKQRKLMMSQNFDFDRYHELCKVFYPNSFTTSGKERFLALDINVRTKQGM